MVELVMRKRKAQPGEVGLFLDTPVFEEELSSIKMGSEVKVVATTPRSLKQHKFIWALATKVAEACDFLETKDDAYHYMLIEAKHARMIYDPVRQISYAVPRATNWGAMDGSSFTKLVKRITHIVGTHIVPGIDKAELKAEIEAMINPDLIPSGPDIGPEPPPIDTIPDGPGHNTQQMAGSSDADVQRRPPRASASYADVKAPGAREATQRAPEAREMASSGNPVRRLDTPGKPDWSKELPGDAHTYAHYAKFHIERKGELGLAMGWLIGDQQKALRERLGLQIGVRKQLERHAAEFYGAKQ